MFNPNKKGGKKPTVKDPAIHQTKPPTKQQKLDNSKVQSGGSSGGDDKEKIGKTPKDKDKGIRK